MAETIENYFFLQETHNITTELIHRLLQNETSDGSETDASATPHSTILRTTFQVYGSILLVGFLLFCYVRQKFPKAYTIRNWADDIKSPLAQDQYGFISWMWKMNSYTEDEILDYCGMDALCTLRILSMGYRICGVGVIIAIVLIPLYSTASDNMTDRIERLTLSNVGTGSYRLIATALAAYMLFGYVMYLVVEEFKWYTEFRHKYLRKPKPRNYSIFVRNIPIEYRSNAGMDYFFRHSFEPENVVEANVRVKAPVLAKAVANREKLLTQFYHALAYEEMTNKEYMVKNSLVGGTTTRALESVTSEIKSSNADISSRIDSIKSKENENSTNRKKFDATSVATNGNADISLLDDSVVQNKQIDNDAEPSSSSRNDDNKGNDALDESNGSGRALLTSALKGISQSTRGVTSGAFDVAASGLSLLKGIEEGECYDSGFVSFTNLCTTNAALQMIHHSIPYTMDITSAPDPEDILWDNIGRDQKDIQVGQIISLAATTALCILWTVPMGFVNNLANVSALREIGFIDDILNWGPWLVPILEQLAPLFVIFINGLLPTILTIFTLREGPISLSVVQTSLFTKLAAFAIIQTFFVSFIGGKMGEITAKFSEFQEEPSKIVDFLASALERKSAFFLQLIFVSNAISLSLEMLRVVPIIIAFIRSLLSPNLTEDERNTPVFGLRPLSCPDDFGSASNVSGVVLIYMVMFVYTVVAPLSVFVLGFCFVYMHACYKHQLLYIYPNRPDSGGKIWTGFIGVMMTCVLIAEVTVFGLMGLKQSAVGAALMLPLLVITVMFNGYIRRQHFIRAAFLPSRDCFKQDLRNGSHFDIAFLNDAYKQEELKTRVKVPTLSPSQIAFLNQAGIETEFGYSDIEGNNGGVPTTVAQVMTTIEESVKSVISDTSISPKK